MSESGNIIMPDNVADIWMSEPELVELFGAISPTLRTGIKAVYKSGVQKEYEVQEYVRLENGCYADVFSFPMIVALAHQSCSSTDSGKVNALILLDSIDHLWATQALTNHHTQPLRYERWRIGIHTSSRSGTDGADRLSRLSRARTGIVNDLPSKVKGHLLTSL